MLALVACAALAGGHEFPVFVWCQDHAGKELPARLLEPFGGVNVERDDPAQWAREHGVDFYVGHGPGRDELHLDRDYGWYDAQWQAFFDERDPEVLVRVPCLTDPKTSEALSANLVKSLAARDGDHGACVSLGDEVGLTPWGDPSDLCHSPTCKAAWTEWVRERTSAERFPELHAGELAPLPATDRVRLAYTDGDRASSGAWLLRRRFHQDVVLETLGRLARESRALAPDSAVGLFGLIGQTAFGGVAIDRILPQLDVVECYSASDARELLYTLREEQQSWCTLFPANGDSDRGAHRLWEHWLRGGDGAIVWSDRQLAKSEGYLARLSDAVRDVRRIDALLPQWRPRPRAVAVVNCPDSIALSFLRDALSDGPTWPRRFAGYQEQHGTRERLVKTWLRALEDCGFLPGSLPASAIDETTVERFPLLVLVEQVVVSEDLFARLERYVAAGGHVRIAGEFAHVAAPGEPLPDDLAEVWIEKRPGSVRRAPVCEDYLERRADPADASAAQFLNEVRKATRAPRPVHVPLTSEPPVPWLRIEALDLDSSRVCVALPNLPDGSLPQLEVRLGHGPPVQWIHPVPAAGDEQVRSVELRAGDALVFRIPHRDD